VKKPLVSSVVLDASALLAYLFGEAGSGRVEEVLHCALISAVNLAETVGKATDTGAALEETARQIGRLPVTSVPFDEEQAYLAASLPKETRHKGLSLGDRACLALGMKTSCPVLTADTAWEGLDIAVEVILIR
jgi:ribonuclease VapC